MTRRGWAALSAALLSSPILGGDGWVTSGKAPAVPPKPVANWQGPVVPKSLTTDDWKPSGPAPVMPGKAEILWQSSRKAVESAPLEEAKSAPSIDPGLLPASFQDQPLVPLPTPKVEAPMPKLIDPIPDVKPAPKPEVKPLPPVSVKPQQSVSVKPQPAPAPTPVTTIITVDESTAVWGSYSSTPRRIAGTNPPVRHKTYGSPSLQLSRDYHVLDGLSGGIANDDGNVVAAEPAAAANSFNVSGEYLLWWVNNGNIPVLATTANNRMFGYIGDPSTTLLLGPGSFGNDDPRSGLRLRGDGVISDGLAWDAGFFFLGSQSNSVSFNSNQFPTIARPFFAPNFGREFAELVAFPGLSTGVLTVGQESFVWGLDANIRCCRPNRPGYWFAGFRNLNLKERLTMTEYITAGPNAPDPQGTQIVVQDQFATRNSFYGAQIGGGRDWRFDNWSLDVRGSLALGVTQQVLEIQGFQARTRPGQATEFFTGGLLAAGPNLGTFNNSEFSVLPEVTFSVGYFVRPNVKLFLGYNFIALTNVVRPGDAIDRIVDLTFVPNAPAVPYSGQPRPAPQFKQSDLTLQGLTFGVQGNW
jgi:hypothetical protein